MKKVIHSLFALSKLAACGSRDTEQTVLRAGSISTSDTAFALPAPMLSPNDFIPTGYVAFDTITGDLNNDGLEDVVLIIKGTDRKAMAQDEYRGKLDRNRRGILVLFRNQHGYDLGVQNPDCFASENEDGGVYYAPELDAEIKNNKLYISYRHGRYGYWSYAFRYKLNDMELIGYDGSQNRGPVVERQVSINFLTRKKQVRTNVNSSAEPVKEVFEETWTTLPPGKPLLLSQIADFEALDF